MWYARDSIHFGPWYICQWVNICVINHSETKKDQQLGRMLSASLTNSRILYKAGRAVLFDYHGILTDSTVYADTAITAFSFNSVIVILQLVDNLSETLRLAQSNEVSIEQNLNTFKKEIRSSS